jgi:UDP-2-acetamido-3-amino-2,3-dideoxy-glucuronate N-acetyltransferase
MSAKIHPTALIEAGVVIGDGTAVWDGVHVRAPSRIGAECIIGEKTYIAYGVDIADRVKINAHVYICTGVTIETGVMVGAGVIFTNDRFPRATTPDLEALLPSEPDEGTPATTVRAGAAIGAGAVVGPGLDIGRFALIGMGAVVTRSVSDFLLVVGNPARTVGSVCRCGQTVLGAKAGSFEPGTGSCQACGRVYRVDGNNVVEEG